MGEIAVILIFGVLGPVLTFYTMVPLLATAWRTGVLPGRVVDYPRTERPKMFWFGVCFCVLMILLSCFAAYAVFWNFVSKLRPA
jgi:hypothetical protein